MLECSFIPERPGTSPGTGTLRLKGSATIDGCHQLRAALLEALGKCRCLVVDVAQVESIDVSGLQLLCSAHKSAMLHDQTLLLGADRSTPFTAQTRDAGYLCTLPGSCPGGEGHSCLWFDAESGNGGTP